MSCTPLPGYDAWKTREPEMDDEACEQCGTALQRERIGGRTYWFCERCDDGPDGDYMRDDYNERNDR